MRERSSGVLIAAAVASAALAACDDGRQGADRPARSTPRPTAATPATDPWPHLQRLFAIARRSGGNRAAGTPGGDRSVAYVVGSLRAAGWQVARQPVVFPYFAERRPPHVVVDGRALRAGADVRTLAYSSGGQVSGRLVRTAGLGCSPGDWPASVRGHIALVRRGRCPFAAKARRAQAAGARAVVVVDAGARGDRGPVAGTLGAPGVRIPAVAVDADGAERLTATDGPVGVRVDAVAGRRRMSNVLAELPGRDPAHVVMAGAHLDSVPAGPGINDDSSGVAALLAIAARLRPDRQRDTLRFAFWAAEELGLYGSRRYVGSLDATERAAVRAYLNFDMVASPNPTLSVYGSGPPATALRDALDAAGPAPLPTSIGGASDHAPFRRAGIPVAGVFTGASEPMSAREARRFGGTADRPHDPCYHRACDTLSNADRPTLERVTNAAETALRSLAG